MIASPVLDKFHPGLKLFVPHRETLCFTPRNTLFHTGKQTVSSLETNISLWADGLASYATQLHTSFDADIR